MSEQRILKTTDQLAEEPADEFAAVVYRIDDHRDPVAAEGTDPRESIDDPVARETDLQAEIEAKQDYVLAELDALDAQILSLLDEFTARLKSGNSSQNGDSDLSNRDEPDENAAA